MAPRISRREVLLLGAAGLVAACSSGGESEGTAAPGGGGGGTGVADAGSPTVALTAADLPPFELSPDFPEGVMSGDPTPDGVVLWTRPSAELVASGEELVAEVAADVAFAVVVASLTVRPDPTVEGSTAFIVDGLEPGTAYAYRFRVGDAVSPIGLTRTAPAPGTLSEAATVAVFSCQRWTHGWYTAHADLATQAPDLVVCLGDYVYETGPADGVAVEGREDPILDARTLEEFRRKYELYRSDPNLQAVHRVAPLVAIPDNHDGSHRPDGDTYPAAHQAFFEKMPVRRHPDDDLRTHRRVTWGDLFDLWMLDVERFQTRSADGRAAVAADPTATYLGEEQRSWLFEGLADTPTTWQVLGSSKQFSPLRLAPGVAGTDDVGQFVNLDQWDGYPAERKRVLEEVQRLGRTGVVAVSGDMHWFWAADVPLDLDDPEAPPVMVDFLCGGISSSNADERIGEGGPQTGVLLEAFAAANANYGQFFDGDRHGYGLLRFTPTAATVQFRSPMTIEQPQSDVEVLAEFALDPTTPGIRLVHPAGWRERVMGAPPG